jgi:hypothetical protein
MIQNMTSQSKSDDFAVRIAIAEKLEVHGHELLGCEAMIWIIRNQIFEAEKEI